MSQSAEIDLTKGAKVELLLKIKHIRTWDNGANYPIYVTRKNGTSMDSIDNIEQEINKML